MRTAEPRIFRATTEAWIGQLLLPLVFFILLTITAVSASSLTPWVGATALALLLSIVFMQYILPMARNWMKMDAQGIEGSLDGRYFQMYWGEVLATWMMERRRQYYLCLGSRLGTLVLPLRFFDDRAVWDWIRTSVPPEALEQNAVQRLPEYRALQEGNSQGQAAADVSESAHQAEIRETLASADTRAVADHWLLQVIGWTGLVFFLFGALERWQDGQFTAVLIFLALAGVSAEVLLHWGITEIGAERVVRFTLFGGWVIDWEQVRWIEIDPFDTVLVLVGEDGQLVIPGPGVWGGGSHKKAALAMLLAQAERRRIPLRHTRAALLRASRNTRMQHGTRERQ